MATDDMIEEHNMFKLNLLFCPNFSLLPSQIMQLSRIHAEC